MRNKILLSLSAIFLSFMIWNLWSLPKVLISSGDSNQVINIYDRYGVKLKSSSKGDSYDWTPLKDIPDELIQLIILAEDRNFFNHSGIDLVSLMRSSWINLKKGRFVTGASTITQQVYRLQHKIPRTLVGKFQTMMGAIWIEQRYSKNEILSHYLNSIPFGKRVSGVKRAADVFFGKELHLLSLAEMASLAVLPRSPSYLLSQSGLPSLRNRRDNLLKNFENLYRLDSGLISYELKTPIQFQFNHSGWENFHYVSRILKHKDLPRYLKGGNIYTNLDSYLQTETSIIVRAHLKSVKKFNANHGAVLVLDNNTGDVLAYVGSAEINDNRGGHFDALIEKRQPGSALKPFTYALSLMNGRELADTLPDIPNYYKTGLGQYLPRNYDLNYSGPRLMREALANSLNLPAVALADELGPSKLYHFLIDLGISFERGPEVYGVGLTLGNAEITPVELAVSYTSLARGESIVQPRFFVDEDIISKSVPLTKEASFLIRDVLSDNIARIESFGEGNVFEMPFEVSVKTGTSTDFRDNWAVGFNKLFTVVVWVGNMNQEPMKKVNGITGAGPILADVFKYLMKNKYNEKDVIAHSLVRHEICALSGKKPGPFCKHKKSEYFQYHKVIAECDFHKEVIVRNCREPDDEIRIPAAIYPEAYQSFVNQRPQWSLEGQVGEQCLMDNPEINFEHSVARNEVQIKKPLNQSIYALDPNIPKNLQKLQIELDTYQDIKSVTWKLNALEFLENDSKLDWPMEKGKHSIKAIVEMIDGSVLETKTIEVTIL